MPRCRAGLDHADLPSRRVALAGSRCVRRGHRGRGEPVRGRRPVPLVAGQEGRDRRGRRADQPGRGRPRARPRAGDQEGAARRSADRERDRAHHQPVRPRRHRVHRQPDVPARALPVHAGDHRLLEPHQLRRLAPGAAAPVRGRPPPAPPLDAMSPAPPGRSGCAGTSTATRPTRWRRRSSPASPTRRTRTGRWASSASPASTRPGTWSACSWSGSGPTRCSAAGSSAATRTPSRATSATSCSWAWWRPRRTRETGSPRRRVT